MYIVVLELPTLESLFPRPEAVPSVASVNRRLEWRLADDRAAGKSNRIFASNVQDVLMRLLYVRVFFNCILSYRQDKIFW